MLAEQLRKSVEVRLHAMLMLNRSRYDFLEKFDHSINPKSFGERGHVWYSYNILGHLLKDGKLPIEQVWRLAGIMAVLQWEKWRAIIYELREKQNLPTYFDGFEHLYNELIKYYQEHPFLNL